MAQARQENNGPGPLGPLARPIDAPGPRVGVSVWITTFLDRWVCGFPRAAALRAHCGGEEATSGRTWAGGGNKKVSTDARGMPLPRGGHPMTGPFCPSRVRAHHLHCFTCLAFNTGRTRSDIPQKPAGWAWARAAKDPGCPEAQGGRAGTIDVLARFTYPKEQGQRGSRLTLWFSAVASSGMRYFPCLRRR